MHVHIDLPEDVADGLIRGKISSAVQRKVWRWRGTVAAAFRKSSYVGFLDSSPGFRFTDS
jgi:hypothetical protein